MWVGLSHGLGAPLNKNEQNRSILSLLPDCKCDVTSNLVLLLRASPAMDEQCT